MQIDRYTYDNRILNSLKLLFPNMFNTYISLHEVKQHNKPDDCWVIIHGKVYDLTKFLPYHPGSPHVILNVAGKDATHQFDDVGHSTDSLIYDLDLGCYMGILEECKGGIIERLHVWWKSKRKINLQREQVSLIHVSDRTNWFDMFKVLILGFIIVFCMISLCLTNYFKKMNLPGYYMQSENDIFEVPSWSQCFF